MVVVLKPAPPRARAPARFLAEGQRRVVLVGIAGPSGSGKTTLAKALVNRLGTPLGSICADNFYDQTRAPREKRRWGSKRAKWGPNLEDPEAIDTEMLLSELYRVGQCLAKDVCAPEKVVLETPLNSCVNLTKKGRKRPGAPLGSDAVVLVVEGFLLFHNPVVAEACTHRLWLDLTCDVAMQRRFQRDGDQESGLDACFEKWYRDSVWANYEEHRLTQLNNADGLEPTAFRIDACQSSEQVLAEALDYLDAHLKCGGILQPSKEVSLRPPRGHVADESAERCADGGSRKGRRRVAHDEKRPARRKRRRRRRIEDDEEDHLTSDASYRANDRQPRHEDNGCKRRRINDDEEDHSTSDASYRARDRQPRHADNGCKRRRIRGDDKDCSSPDASYRAQDRQLRHEDNGRKWQRIKDHEEDYSPSDPSQLRHAANGCRRRRIKDDEEDHSDHSTLDARQLRHADNGCRRRRIRGDEEDHSPPDASYRARGRQPRHEDNCRKQRRR
mmetsp:Transcript_118559/g.330777  ORF Transcript_118559/g.330777 Transcript_118559/m.330777 type:complete len:501 (-) Transcript_118559:110-1612(-)